MTDTTETELRDIAFVDAAGKEHTLAEYRDNVVMIVNVASKCGLTPQYEGLEALYEKYGKDGLVVMGFPCNQFEGQEPGTAEEIAEFCTVNFGVKFPMFGKVEVNGPGADPLFKWLKSETPGSDNRDVEWNFAKFLVGRDGKPVKRFGDKFMPADIAQDIEKLL